MTDPIEWQPTCQPSTLIQRAALIENVRNFFKQRSVLEVETPLLAHASVTDVHLSSFKTNCYPPGETSPERAIPLALITSPEYHMKRLIAAGSGSIYQICKCFRNHEESSRNHNPEFTMLEWYRTQFTMRDLIQEVDELFQAILNCQPAERASYQSLFITHLNLDPLSAPQSELVEAVEQLNIGFNPHDCDRDTLLQVLFTFGIEPKIGLKRPIAVYHFPASQASLALIPKEDHRVANRFEFYYRGIELCNGFEELQDPDEQLTRFEEDNRKRQALGLPQEPIDHFFIEALKNGMPACSGVAVGLDRLIMLALNKTRLEEVTSFTLRNA